MSYTHTAAALGTGEIRLIRFAHSPDHGDSSQLRFEMRQAPVRDDKTKYAALSYVWGDQGTTATIFINGCPLQVGQNLHDVLLHLRRRGDVDESWLWIDAICINQLNLGEKALHVAMMGDIYIRAELVYVWLGPGCELSDLAMDWISRVGPVALSSGMLELRSNPHAEDFIDNYVLTHLPSPEKKTRPDITDPDEDSTKQAHFILELLRNKELHSSTTHKDYVENRLLAGIKSLMQSEYWTRIWTFQELALGKQSIVLCGNKGVDLEVFEAAMESIEHCIHSGFRRLHPSLLSFAYDLPANFYESIGLLSRRVYRSAPSSVRLSAILYHIGLPPRRPYYVASDPKDILFGLLGFLSDEDRLEFTVDYTMSMSQVFIILTRALIRNHSEDGRSYKLDHCPPREPDNVESDGLPSWVPDWREIGRHGMPVFPINYAQDFNASLGLKADLEDSSPIKRNHESEQAIEILRRHGCVVDIVTEVMKPAEWFTDDPWLASIILDGPAWIDSIREFTNLTSGDSSPGEDYVWRTVTLGYYDLDAMTVDEEIAHLIRMIFRKEAIDVDHLTERQQKYIREGPYNLAAWQPHLQTLRDQVDFLQHNVPTNTGTKARERTLFKTRKNMLGLGHVVVRQGDVVVLLEGVEAPVVLRNRPDGGYLFMGDAYVDGIMQGEFMHTQPAVEAFELY